MILPPLGGLRDSMPPCIQVYQRCLVAQVPSPTDTIVCGRRTDVGVFMSSLTALTVHAPRPPPRAVTPPPDAILGGRCPVRGDELSRDRVPVRLGLQPSRHVGGVPQLPGEARGALQLLRVRLLRGRGEEPAAPVGAAAGRRA